METKERNIFDVITGYSVNEGLDKSCLEDEEYRDIQKRMDELTEQLDAEHFTKEQRLLIGRLICVHTENGAHYGRVTHRQGMRDCAALICGLGLVRI